MHSSFSLYPFGALALFVIFLAIFCYWLFSWTKQKIDSSVHSDLIDNAERWTTTKSNYGGVLFFVAFLLGTSFELLVSNSSMNVWVYIAAIAAFALGRWDDLCRISAAKKFAGQFIVAILMMIGGLRLGIFPEPIDLIFSVLFVVAIMNSFNMLDNMDAVSSIVALGVFVFIIIWHACAPQSFAPDVIILSAAVLAFLVFNWHPSKIFMGDSGTMLLGMYIAYLLMCNNTFEAHVMYQSNIIFTDMGVTAFTILALPIVDTTVVIIQRLRHGVSPFQGGRDHTTHHLVYCGLSERSVALLFVLLTCVSIALSLTFQTGTQWMINENKYLYEAGMLRNMNYIFALPNVVYILLLFSIMLFISFRNLRLGKYSYKK